MCSHLDVIHYAETFTCFLFYTFAHQSSHTTTQQFQHLYCQFKISTIYISVYITQLKYLSCIMNFQKSLYCCRRTVSST